MNATPTTAPTSVYDFAPHGLAGQTAPLDAYRG
jgi:hypothetical protein